MSDPTRPLRTCDIVMKGGVTSGVVYPLAITRLSRRFVFKNIGGTSAGAIAAAATAAAEFRRQARGDSSGFERLAKLPELLVQQPQGTGRTRLFQFFQPSAGTRRMFDLFTSAMDRPKWTRLIGQALRACPRWSALGATPGALLAVASLMFGHGGMALIWMLVGGALALAGAVAGAVGGIVRDLLREVPRHGFGLCTGMSPVPYSSADDAPAAALSVWLTGYLNETAGLPPDGAPLTFGQLWQANPTGSVPGDRAVNLEMMTTNLTHRRPYRLPLRDDDELKENALFFFRAEELGRYFPAHVVQWMIDHPRKPREDDRTMELLARLRTEGFYPMPAPEDLPVAVATRMSLSFPLLLCAVPLHAIDWSLAANAAQARDKILPERCWFSDGGMCSNFPLHFFDSALPRRPTFSIDLVEKPDDTPDAAMRPDIPRSNSAHISERWSRFDTEPPAAPGVRPVDKAEWQKLLGFVWSMIATMQNWTDTTQGRLPGYRDRIVGVPLRPGKEGGLNLNMPVELIRQLSARGEEAAQVLQEHFDVPPTEATMTWDNHRWIRLRATLAALEKTLEQMVIAMDHPESGDIGYEDWIKQMESRQRQAPSYEMKQAQLVAARETLEQLRIIQQIWGETKASDGAPRPRPILRPRPQI